MRLVDLFKGPPRKPCGLKWRSSVAFTTAVVGFGITTDLMVESILVPVVPFQLENLNYHSISSLTGWLLSAYSVGQVTSTLPIAVFSEKTSSRRTPLIIGLFCLLVAQILFMESPNYAAMVVARVLQGISSSMVWIVGLALICDVTPQQKIGTQIGLAMTGLSIGIMAGTPVGGNLYARFGLRAPYIFGEICTLVDLMLRLLIIERDVALKWGYDPTTGQDVSVVADLETSSSRDHPLGTMELSPSTIGPVHSIEQTTTPVDPKEILNASSSPMGDMTMTQVSSVPSRKPLPILSVIGLIMKSPRAGVALFVTLVSGITITMEGPTLPLRLQDVWGYTSGEVSLIYLASVVPTLISSPLSGLLHDKFGPGYTECVCLLLAIPWSIALVFRKSIALFVVSMALESFFLAGLSVPVNAELEAVSRSVPGVGYAHIYGAFNLVFGIGSAVGPLLGGQIYGHVRHGWAAVCYLTASLALICVVPVFCYAGEDPLRCKLLRYRNAVQAPSDQKVAEKDPGQAIMVT